MRSYIKKAHQQVMLERKEHALFKSIPVYIKDPLPENINLEAVLRTIESRIPVFLFSNIDAVYVGEFELFNIKKTNAAYQDGALYISNTQDDEEDMLDDIIHESAHAVEEQFLQEIYASGEVEREFLGKRERLFHLLKAEGYNVDRAAFMNPEYSDAFDVFLYDEVGYPILTSLTMGLFVSPYGITSLREYFANGYEHYFLGEQKYVKNISPQIYNTIEKLISYED